jgi:tetratricopeptide (TPR) repeat protein
VIDPDALAALEDQQRFLDRSLDDLEREHDAGDLDDADYESLKADYADRAAAVSEAIEAGRAQFVAARTPASTGRRVAAVAGIAAFALVCGFVVAFAVGRRDAGQTITGNAQTASRVELSKCFSEGQVGKLLEATQCYGAIIKAQPDNAEALTYLGWFLYLAASETNQPELATDAPGFLERAVTADPSYPDAHVFLAVIAKQDGRTADALAQLDALDALHPTAEIQQLADSLRAALTGASTTLPGAATTAPGAPATTTLPAAPTTVPPGGGP